jgi:hypothetical protein
MFLNFKKYIIRLIHANFNNSNFKTEIHFITESLNFLFRLITILESMAQIKTSFLYLFLTYGIKVKSNTKIK